MVTRAINEVTYLRYLQMREQYKDSVRSMMVASTPILGVTNYIGQKTMVETGYKTSGMYVLNSDIDRNIFCDRAIKTPFLHKTSAIDRVLDCDFIDTENTDYTYIRDEESISDCSNIPSVGLDSSEEPEINMTTSLTFNGKDISIYQTEYLYDSITAPEST
uniref:Uncharacterized protein n=1 Tax=Euplotes crassus TaxID=5936 RepID=A0A7S3P2C2_EUPCR|mmetsp:Transcript_7805/g.7374  ORF Transcript_7805/g.7374 Transcript_7805/m.7374 type:complete len:161 (+) Transcript_7805:255-737(+)